MLRPGIAAVCIVALSACGFPSLNVSDEDAGAHDAQVGDASTDAAGFDAATNSATADAGTDAACDAARDAGCEAPAEPCRPGDMELCYSEPVSISLNPPCHAGVRICEGGKWSTCAGEVLPEDELCNDRDDDCDGTVDEAQAAQSCAVPGAKGECATGARVCASGKTTCVQVVWPVTEICNVIDDDCDGAVDEDTSFACYDGQSGCTPVGDGTFTCLGACRSGVIACTSGVQTACSGEVAPGTEVGESTGETALDEDCDGTIDEGIGCVDATSRACYAGPADTVAEGPCHSGTMTCIANAWGTCSGQALPGVEACDNEGADDDCNGVMDDVAGLGTACTVPALMGNCMQGTLQCAGGASTSCVTPPASDEACDGLDDDCDGAYDEGFDPSADQNNCGGCGQVCNSARDCCYGACVDLTTSNNHCGRCDHVCAQGTTCCDSKCVNLQRDLDHCGTCAQHCTGGLTHCWLGLCRP